jgi:uncharacterized membrane protein
MLVAMLCFTPESALATPLTPASGEDLSYLPSEVEYATGVVIALSQEPESETPNPLHPMGGMNTVENVTVKVTTGSWAGETLKLKNILSGHPAYDIPLEEGARVLLTVERYPDRPPEINIADRARTPATTVLLGLFLLGFLLLAGKHALKVLLLVGGVIMLFDALLIPATLAGKPILFTLLLILMAILALALYLLPLSRPQRVVMATASLSGLCVTLLALVFALGIAPLQGFTSEELAGLWQMNPHIDFPGILLAGGLVGYLGFLLGLSYLLARRAPYLPAAHRPSTFLSRFQAGLAEGQEPLALLIGGLALLYLGLYLSWWFQLTEIAPPKFFNLESVASVVVVALSGGLGLITTVPVAAGLSAWNRVFSSTNPTTP